jgi:hypothetical protein
MPVNMPTDYYNTWKAIAYLEIERKQLAIRMPLKKFRLN